MSKKIFKIIICLFFSCPIVNGQSGKFSRIADNAWADNSVNTVIFRKNSLVTFGNTQYAAYYDTTGHVVVAKRNLKSDRWEVKRTTLTGNAADAHKSISMMVDGDGYLHICWGQHNDPLNYVKSLRAGALTFTGKLQMIGDEESKVTYPEFYKMPNGNLLFFYRDGGSGNGNLVVNLYNRKNQRWTRQQTNLLDGEGQRSAYWQVAIDETGTIHLSWVWRENPDVASNHDICYACSKDGGNTWQKSTGDKYLLPINANSSEYACHIRQHSDLINQTSMCADADGHPVIATYFKDSANVAPQYHLIFNKDGRWKVRSFSFNKSKFTLSGEGTKKVPLSRPQIIGWKEGSSTIVALIFRDRDFGNQPYLAVISNLDDFNCKLVAIENEDLGDWEPTFDTELWREHKVLSLFIEKVTQIDGEGNEKKKGNAVGVLNCTTTQL